MPIARLSTIQLAAIGAGFVLSAVLSTPIKAAQESGSNKRTAAEIEQTPAVQAIVQEIGVSIEVGTKLDQWGSRILAQASSRDVRVAELLDAALPAEPPTWITEASSRSLYYKSLQLALAERLYFTRRYNELLTWTEGLNPEEVYSPELLIYLRVVARRQTVDYDSTRQDINTLDPTALEGMSLSRQAVLEHLRRELEQENPEGLQRVTRLMEDSQRRLAQQSVGQPTQTQQQRAIDDLDQLIKDLEEQQKKMQQAQCAGGMGGASPAEESRPSDLKAPGEVDRKRMPVGDSWGDLPPAERERLAQEITRDYPARYRTLIGEYFEALASPVENGLESSTEEEGAR